MVYGNRSSGTLPAFNCGTMNTRGSVRSSPLAAALVALGLFVFPFGAEAQQGKGRGRQQAQEALQFKPPPGMCRIWIEGVPAARQPAPTDCGTALRDRPANGRVIFGDALPSSSRPAQKGKGKSGK
jgi:hypothetical protein